MKLKSHIVTQEIGGQHMLVAAMEKEGDFHGIVKSNETAAFVVEALKEDVTEDEILAKLQTVYEGDEADMRADIQKVIADLSARGLLES